jgi:hypothetical protein
MIMRKERLKKENEVFAESLINDFIKRIEDFNSDELALLSATYNQIKKYTEDIQNGYEKMFINFLPPQKTPRSIELLPACELPTHAKGDGMGFGFHRACFVSKV